MLGLSVLGPVEVSLAGAPVDLGTPKQRALVAALALSRGWPVSVDGDRGPALGGPRAARRDRDAPGLRLPAAAGDGAGPGTPGAGDRAGHGGARLRAAGARRGRRRLPLRAGGRSDVHRTLLPLPAVGSVPAPGRGAARSRRRRSTRRSGWWRGAPYAELGDADAAFAERARLDELRLVALEDRAVVELALGRHATVAAELEAMTAAHPLRERLWALWAVALTRSGRQADALDVLARVRADPGRGARPRAVRRAARAADRGAPAGRRARVGRAGRRSRRPAPATPAPVADRLPVAAARPRSRSRRGRWSAGTTTWPRWCRWWSGR